MKNNKQQKLADLIEEMSEKNPYGLLEFMNGLGCTKRPVREHQRHYKTYVTKDVNKKCIKIMFFDISTIYIAYIGNDIVDNAESLTKMFSVHS